MEDKGYLNTDKELWRKVPDDYYSPSIHVTEFGDIGIDVGGYVLVAPIEAWHKAGIEAFTVPDPNINFFGTHIKEAINTIKNGIS